MRDYPWQWTWHAACYSLGALSLALLSTHPHRTFEIVFVFPPLVLLLIIVPVAIIDYAWFSAATNKLFFFSAYNNALTACALLPGLGAYVWAGRAHARESPSTAGGEASLYTRERCRVVCNGIVRESGVLGV